MKIVFELGKRKIASLWFIFSGLIFLAMFLQAIIGKFENYNQEAWGWFSALVLPNLSLMLSVFISDFNKNITKQLEVDIFFYRLTFGMSFLYLISILLVLIIQPTSLTQKPIILLMNESYIFLGPFQGLVSGSLGFFFIKSKAINE